MLLFDCGNIVGDPMELTMSVVSSQMTTTELLQLAADNHQKKIELSATEKSDLMALLRQRGQDELDYGQELEVANVRLVKRVTGAVGIYFS